MELDETVSIRSVLPVIQQQGLPVTHRVLSHLPGRGNAVSAAMVGGRGCRKLPKFTLLN